MFETRIIGTLWADHPAPGTVAGGYGQHSIGNAAQSDFTANQQLLSKIKKVLLMRHRNAIARLVLLTGFKLTFIVNLLQFWALGSTKLSVLFFYRRIFRGKAFNIISWTVIAMVLAWSTASFFWVLFQCNLHFQLLWSSAKIMAKNCLPAAPIEFFNSSVDVATDIVILSLPVYWVSVLRAVVLLSITQEYLWDSRFWNCTYHCSVGF